MTLTQCDCETTAHDPGCPFYDPPGDVFVDETPSRPTRKGWICPACGRGNAPWNPSCECVGALRFPSDNTSNWTTI